MAILAGTPLATRKGMVKKTMIGFSCCTLPRRYDLLVAGTFQDDPARCLKAAEAGSDTIGMVEV